MRPRPDAAENARRRGRAASGRTRFNEAAARCRGKRIWPAAPTRRRRRFNEAAARCRGKLSGSPRGPRTSPCFNEAAARCRGKLPPRPRPPAGTKCFNEAAARCRGKPTPVTAAGTAAVASMRPRPDAAENAVRRRPGAGDRRGFNEAAARCRGKRQQPESLFHLDAELQ